MLSSPVASWASSDGKIIHTDFVKYLKGEIEIFFARITENSVAARKIVDSLNSESIVELATLLDHLGAEVIKPSVFNVSKEETGTPVLRLTSAA